MKKYLLIIISLFILTGCFTTNKKSKPKPEFTIDTNHLSNDDCYLYYYQTLSKKQKKIYENIYNCLTDNAKKVSISSSDYELVQKISNYVLYDHPEIYYLDYFELQNQVEVCNYIPIYSYTKNEQKEINTQLDTIKNNFINSIPSNANDYDKLKLIYQYVIDKCSYLDNAKDNQHITSSLINGPTVCSGYVKAIQYLCNALNINSAYIIGEEVGANENEDLHAWNMINLEDDYYYLDATWGDYVYEDDSFCMMNYFMFDSNEMLKFYKPLDKYKKTKTGKYSYFKYENLYSDTFDKSKLSDIIQYYKDNNITWMEFKFSDSCYEEAKNKLINQEEMFDLFNVYTNTRYSIEYIYYDDLNLLVLHQVI